MTMCSREAILTLNKVKEGVRSHTLEVLLGCLILISGLAQTHRGSGRKIGTLRSEVFLDLTSRTLYWTL